MRVMFDPAILGLLEVSQLPHDRQQTVDNTQRPSPTALADQLEGQWKGVDALSTSRVRAFNQLAGVVVGRTAQEARLAFIFEEVGLSSVASAILDDCALFHAHNATVAIAFIARAKEANGVMPSSEFHWLRKEDPPLWSMVNGFGQPRHAAGIVGAFTHYKYELTNGRSVDTHFDDFEIT